MECDGEASWVKLIGEVLTAQSVDQYLDWITNPSPGEEVPNTEWLIAVFPSAKIYDKKQDPDIKPWAQPVKTMGDLLKKSCNIRGSLVFSPYCWPDGVK